MTDAQRFGLEMDLIRSRVLGLPVEAKGVLALACAQRVVRANGKEFADIEDVLNSGWSVVQFGQGDCASLRRALESREDLDDDPIAAAAYAMGAVDGDAEAAWWATSRLLDSAFERVPYPAEATSFRPVAEDAQHETVRQELRWIDEALSLLEQQGATRGVIDHLRM